MASFMKPWSPHTYALMRIMAGLLFLCHGLQKLVGFPATPPGEVPAFITYVAGPIELFGGALIAIGWQTRWAAFIASGLMAAAYFMAHFPQGFLPIANQGELAVLYCFVFLFISAHGAGIWSVEGSQGQG
jgi:putative oxidoreductase